jgi:peptide chain release factor 3
MRDGLTQLLEEGVIQSFDLLDGIQTAPLLGAVGQLQFEVVAYRLTTEYGAEPRMEPAPFTQIRWFSPGIKKEQLSDLFLGTGARLATDVRGQLVILFPDKWAVDYFIREHATLTLHAVSPHSSGAVKSPTDAPATA